MNQHWQRFAYPALEDIREARDQSHQAIQNVSAVGRSFLPPSEQDENANLEWDNKLQRLVGRWVTGEHTFRSSISIRDFMVYLVNENFETISSISMQGAKQTDIMVWLEKQIVDLGADFSKINLAYPYELPAYPTAAGAAFGVSNPMASEELSRLYHNADLMLRHILSKENKTTEIKCWPHHFDIAGSIILLDTGDPETSKQIGVGMSPGDEHYDEPYFYVSPWPYPVKELPDISATQGHWHSNNWIGGVLRYSELNQHDLIQDQIRVIKTFYSTTIDILKNL
ncbi:hypothetical protein SAMN04488028_102155 [Reichenbachiella agariperforans]|uniref:Uncharacterized protein n=1 Tax=Reichenbachiella agariperforans TaxID=156994 RepID=A0A1M6N9F0_REIAG|nr:hypothetical protein [Reichenbachiella agariperforans]SHJ92186.1 hypothetical protein SAMN04488028_102155 [Reichenbachiella agariperforans]